ncbi:mast cell protease 1-like [Centruroides sculpturatus]|uniref:mast cell protease 1-like n=1 Tax=Centruroides sculpturatus TaxID=218467 RepID=UPI000C6C8CB6|nr:mast cell protease 1-like [Centruroides sculpturatus]
MKNFIRFGILLLLNTDYLLCVSERNEYKSVNVRRMIGGSVAERGSFLFMVAIFCKDIFQGAFSLITTHTLIGAAHVVESYVINDYYGRIDDVNKYKGKKIMFGKRCIHPDHVPGDNLHDIALLILQDPIEDIFTIALPGRNVMFTKGLAVFAGWGKTSLDTGEYDNNFLRVAEVNLIDPKSVDRSFHISVTGEQIITETFGVKATKGDSGSPLIIIDDSRRRILIGILTNPNNDINKPDIYISTSAHYNFINASSVGRPTFVDV